MDIRISAIAKKLIDEIESNQFMRRRRDEYKSYKVAEGGQRTFIDAELKRLFPKSWENMRISDVSISNKILNKVSKSYSETPIRDFGKQTDELNDILENGRFDSVMSEFDRDYNRQRYGLLWVNEIGGEISFHSLKGFESFVKVDQNSGKPRAVVINYPDGNITTSGGTDGDGIEQQLMESQDDTSAETRTYAMWTDDYHAVWNVKKHDDDTEKNAFTSVEIAGNPDNINPLGMLPFVFESQTSSFDLPFLNQITDQSIMYNLLASDYLSAMSLQGFGILVVSHAEGTVTEKMHSGITTGIHLPIIQGADAQPDAKFINPNPDLTGMKETIETYAREVLDEHGISSSSAGSTQKFSSGIERMISMADVSDKIQNNRRVFTRIEKNVVDILIAYEKLRDGDDTLKTTFQKSKVLISDSEVLTNIKSRMDMGLITKVEALQIIDPNLNDDDAQSKIDKINDEKTNNVNTFMGGLDANRGNKNIIRNGFADEIKREEK